MMPYLFFAFLFFNTLVIADEEWFERNCTPQNSDSIYQIKEHNIGNYHFELTSIKNDARRGEWYDPLCGKSSIKISNSNDPSFKSFHEMSNGYPPVLLKIIKNNKKELYALIDHHSGGTAGSYISVISLQTGKLIDTLQNAYSLEMEDGKLTSLYSGYEQNENCSTEYFTTVYTTYIHDKKYTQYKKDGYSTKFKSREEFMKECPELDIKIMNKISKM